MKLPILFLIFNRPELVLKSIQSIKRYAPDRIFISCDGPRDDNSEDRHKISQVKNIIRQEIDWNCEIITNYEKKNLGCKKAVSSALNWFFNYVSEGIILEDDCVASDDFFIFCEHYLSKYSGNPQIMHISGNNFLSNRDRKKMKSNLFISTLPHVWGWATWRRAWKKYDNSLREFQLNPRIIEDYFPLDDDRLKKKWLKNFENVASGRVNTWDYQWVYACWRNGSLCINPAINLVENIGFTKGNSTHTQKKPHWWRPIEVSSTDLFQMESSTELEYDQRLDKADYQIMSSSKILSMGNVLSEFSFKRII